MKFGIIKNRLFVLSITLFFLMIFVLYFIFLSSPREFPNGYILTIDKGLTLSEVGDLLHDEGLIRHPFMYKVFTVIFSGKQNAVSGDYFFKDNSNVMTVSYKIARGEYGLTPIRITFPEGSSSRDMAKILSYKINPFDEESFIKKAEAYEGYLFPDTYFFLPNAGEGEIISTMRENFNDKIEKIEKDIKKSEYELDEIINMASILEKEAINVSDMKIISGILWKRMERGMPLQVDAPFVYFLNKNSFELTLDDLKIDDPYNTYIYKGLPKGPISNPGLDSILASIYYDDSPYWYYLSDLNSIVYYAKNFDEHKTNKFKYLK